MDSHLVLSDKSYLLKYEYVLKHGDINVLKFKPSTRELTVLNHNELPVSIRSLTSSYEMIEQFCADRILLYNREYCKEILLSMRLDDQSPLNICLVSNALSFFDTYWITKLRDTRTWKDVNLHKNTFSTSIARTGLTGNMQEYDNLFTGELTLKGTRPKGIFREADGIYLYKNETDDEIASEIISSYIASLFGLNASMYTSETKFGKDCSKCKIIEYDGEAVYCRDLLSFYHESQCTIQSNTFKYFFENVGLDFILMMIFDYVTMNTDRNRDNYAVLVKDNKIKRLYPIYDHDSCFKGKSEDAIYFPTTLTFHDTIERLKKVFSLSIISHIRTAIEEMQRPGFKAYFIELKSNEEYKEMLHRTLYLLKER